jgi:hypothetical protein
MTRPVLQSLAWIVSYLVWVYLLSSLGWLRG